jgi:hypothetical protein
MTEQDNNQLVAEALRRLGAAYSDDWSDFDGRSLHAELDHLADALISDEPFNLNRWTVSEGICPKHLGWAYFCPDRIPLPDDHPARARGMTEYAGNNCQHLFKMETDQ